MNKRHALTLMTAALLLSSTSVIAEEPSRELLWPNGAPGAKGNDPANDQPAITIHSPAKSTENGTAVVICPGGGYGHLSMDHEGHEMAKWLNRMGITGVVLEYRMNRGGYHHPIPLLDAQRALRTVRSRADELNLDPSRIGIMGFSAGGHLASTAGTHFDTGDPNADDPVDRLSCRPDFMILCYPVIAFGEPYTHKGSQRKLIGENPPQELVTYLSNEKQVTADTPPTFLFHTDEDTSVPAENSVMFYLALRKAGVPAELHVYRKGRHGRGLAQDTQGTSDWPEACKQWLAGMGLLTKSLAENQPSNLDLYLLIGQSNMAGRAPFTEKESGVIDGVYLLNDQDQWEPAQNPLNRYSTIRKNIEMQKMNPGYGFAKTMVAKQDGIPIGLVVNAKGGTAIEQWEKDTEFYNEAVRRAKAAQKSGTLKGILWHQGESNSKNPEAYAKKLETLIENLREDLDAPELPFVAGEVFYNPETKPHTKAINDQIAKTVKAVPFTGCAKAGDLTTLDHTHFDTRSMNMLGRRYAEETLRIQKEK